MGGKSSTSTSTTELPPEIKQAYTSLVDQAKTTASTPYQAYSGGVNGTGMEQNQLTGFDSIANAKGSSDGSFNSASNALNSTATPTSASVDQYMSPYLNSVVQSTMANMNEQNAQQQQGVLGNAAAQGALGGNRVGVAQSELARQQNLANQSTISNLYNTGYNTALSAAQSDKSAALQAAQGYTNLGQTSMQTNLSQAAAQVGAGTQQQQWNYQQYQNEKSYPFETTSWLANIVEGLGSGQSKTTTTSPSGNTGSSILGGALSLGSLFLNKGGAVHGERPHRAQGGVIPYSNPSGIVSSNNNNPSGVNDNSGYVPQVSAASANHTPSAPVQSVSPNSGDQDLQKGIQSMGKAIEQKYPNGILAGATPATPTATAPSITPSTDQSLISKIGGFLGFADGGVARRGYDEGGYVDPSTPGVSGFDPSTISAADILALLRAKNSDVVAEQSPVSTPDVVQTPDAGVVAPKTDRVSVPNENLGDRFGPANTAPPITNASDLATALAKRPDVNVDAAPPTPTEGVSNAVPSGVIPVPTPRPEHYVDPQVVASTQASTPDVVPTLPSPTEVKDHPIAGVIAAPSSQGASYPKTYNVGNAPQMAPQFDKINSSYGLPDGYLNRTAYIESTFNPNANNGISKGEFQFTKSTAGQYGLKDPFDPIASADAAARLASDNAKFLSNGLGRQPTGGELYLAHQQGAAGALNLITHPNAPATDIVGRQAVVQNGGSANMTAGQFANLWVNKYNGAGGGRSSGTSIPSDTASSSSINASPSQSGVISPTSVADDPRGIVSSILHGERPNISNDMRMALLSAGLGMMSGTSPNFATNVGTGGQKGIESYMAKQALNRQNAQAQSEIATRAGQLGLEGKRVDLAGQELALNAKKAAADIGLQTAQTGKTNLETQTNRFQQTVTPAGIIVRDMTDPNAPPRLTTWDDIQKNGPPSSVIGSNEAVGASVAAGSSQPAPQQRPTSSENAPVASRAAPVTPIAAPSVSTAAQAPQSTQTTPVFQSSAPSHIPMDARMLSPTGQQIVTSETTDGLKQARAEYQGATSAQTQLAEMKHDLATLPNSSWTTPGTGFNTRVQWAKAINTAVQGMGMQAPIDEKAVAAGEDLNKLTTRLGFDLSKSLGSREAASIIDQSVSAVPGGANSPEGARRVIAGIEAVNQRKLDYYNFLQDWSAKTGGSIKGADEYFNKTNPPELYALTTYVPTPAMDYLRQHPEAAKDFDAKYGMGHSVSKYVLGGK